MHPPDAVRAFHSFDRCPPLWKIRDLRDNDILKQDGKFDLSNEKNIKRLLNVSDISHKKYLEYVAELQKVEAEVETWGLAETINLTEENFYWEIKIELK